MDLLNVQSLHFFAMLFELLEVNNDSTQLLVDFLEYQPLIC